MTDEELSAIEARAKAASEGPWEAAHVFRDGAEIHSAAVGEVANIRNFNTSSESAAAVAADAAFIAHARTDVPALLQALRASRARVEELERANGEAVREVELLLSRLRAGETATLWRSATVSVVEAMLKRIADLKPSAAKESDRCPACFGWPDLGHSKTCSASAAKETT